MLVHQSDPRHAAVAELTLLTTLDVASVLTIPHRAVLRLVRIGDLKPTKTFGKSDHRFSREDLRQWIQGGKSSAVPSEPAPAQ